MKILQVASTIGLSTFKHTLGGVPLAAGFGFSYMEVALYTALGGIAGIIIFIFLSQLFSSLWNRAFPNRKKKKKKVFTKKARFIVRVKQRFGLAGIAFITPWLLSVPVGTIISYSIYQDRTRVFLYQTASVLFWSFLGAALARPIAQIFLA